MRAHRVLRQRIRQPFLDYGMATKEVRRSRTLIWYGTAPWTRFFRAYVTWATGTPPASRPYCSRVVASRAWLTRKQRL